MSHLTPEELDALQTSKLPRDTPYLIQGVSHGMFSIARHYGGAKYNGKFYSYVPTTDELIREDVVKWLAKRRTAAKKAGKAAAEAKQLTLESEASDG